MAGRAAFPNEDLPAGVVEALRAGERTGRPLGSREFAAGLEARPGRRLRPGPREVGVQG